MVDSLLSQFEAAVPQPAVSAFINHAWLEQELKRILHMYDSDLQMAHNLEQLLTKFQLAHNDGNHHTKNLLKRFLSFGLLRKINKPGPLDAAMNAQGDSAFMILVRRAYFHSAECLLRHGAQANTKNKKNQTALNQAIKQQRVATIRFLLNKGVQSPIIRKSIFDQDLDLLHCSQGQTQIAILLLLAKAAYYLLLDFKEVRQCLMLAYGLDPIVADRYRQEIINEQLFEYLPDNQRLSLADECLQIKIDFHLNDVRLFNWDDEVSQGLSTWQ